ncbi:MAG: hypothetical protein M3040_06255, partial [Bacteroidota bacterium]|nr:hypothetical protein [Bacteroidota bacterium]
MKFLIAGTFLFCHQLHAQDIKVFDIRSATKDSISDTNSTSQKDIADVISSVFRKKEIVPTHPEVISTKPIYSVVPAVGYSLQTKLAAVVSGNVVFHIT